ENCLQLGSRRVRQALDRLPIRPVAFGTCEATIRAERRTIPLFGMGLVDAVPDEAFFALARLEARYSPDSAGCPNIVADVVTGGQGGGRRSLEEPGAP